MNMRINEIARQSGVVETTDPAVMEFAKRIIQECSEVCLNQRDPTNLNYKPSQRFSEEILRHFGQLG